MKRSFIFAKQHPDGPQTFWWEDVLGASGGPECPFDKECVVCDIHTWLSIRITTQNTPASPALKKKTKKGVFDDLKQIKMILFHGTGSYCKFKFALSWSWNLLLNVAAFSNSSVTSCAFIF